MASAPDLLAFYRDLYDQAGLGPVTTRAMFGGAGVFKDGVMVALVAFDQLYFKTDAETRPRFEAEGLPPFTYDGKRGRPVVMSYSLCPDAALEDPELFADWAGQAIKAARRAGRR
ncbi:MAG: TfoX/Sxy family protein [Marivibrio sp.]|uniref:TfoX/Sxy family protein n=1 Tax=Marivibrio sp. TaxID=2039719 RepID=UPI0032EC1C95